MRVTILIPTYNEKENIESLLRELLFWKAKLKDQVNILIVDDNSPDGTSEVVASFQKKQKDIFLLSGKKQGLGKAMIRGYFYSMRRLKAEVVVSNEADFGFSFTLLPKMLDKIKDGYDVVVASRHVGLGKTKGWNWQRTLNHFIANTVFAKYIAGVNEVYDKNGAMRAVRVKGVLEKIRLEKMRVTGFAFFFYSLFKLSRVTNKFFEIPAVYHFRKLGESKVSFNPKYLKTYVRDVSEYVYLAFRVRLERLKVI